MTLRTKIKGSSSCLLFLRKTMSWQCDIILINQPNTVVGTKNAGSKVLFRVDLAGFEIE